jgi:mRNA interferase MazF
MVTVQRGDVYDVDLDPAEGSEQAGRRPIVIVSRNAINAGSNVVVGVPLTTHRSGRRLYPSHVVLKAPEGGLSAGSVALCEQVRALSKTRLARRRGALSAPAMARIERGLLIALDLPSSS